MNVLKQNGINMKKKRNKQGLDLFSSTFLGEYVGIMTKMKSTIVQESEESSVTQTAPMLLKGYLLDMDTNYYYLGDTANEVSQAIKKVQVFHIEIEKPMDALDHMLEGIETPSNKKAYN